MKKTVLFILIFVIVLSFSACNSAVVQDSAPDVNVEDSQPVTTSADQPPVYVDQLPLNITINPPEYDTVWMTATYTNNSTYPITGINVAILLKETNETTYLSCYDTVMPGETSPNFETFGPPSQNKADMEILTYSISYFDENDTECYIDYDAKLGLYEWY